ncbi:peptidoglycan DD-metalloendopeptidase family protein [Roseivirga sp.]|uniref:peptidoglycan DD-metalloendopeptidase family protein n=1 Tax=Roseivirga sp. TaxID=1964215 RepID=UPI002B26C92C|nr:peptidoglycan DD-metalloendopeptidase family protein [Roseivirga sp.]
MKKLIASLIILGFSTIAFAQGEKEVSKKTASEFKRLFNQSEYNSIFEMFSPEMKIALPSDQTLTFLQNVKSQAGALKSLEFVKYEQGMVALYKAQFDRKVLGLNLSTDQNSKINGMLLKPYQDNSQPKLERNISSLILPFNGEWTVFWGGDTEALNYHVTTTSQKGAFDFLIMDESGKSYSGDGSKNEDYYAFGKELIAPAAGEVVLVVDGIKDNKPGTMNPIYIPGNTVIIKTANNEYLLLAHFKQHSIKVKQGDRVTQGQVLGLSGNSGNSSEPHLHFHIQNMEEMSQATGAKSYFESIKVNGKVKTDYSPIKGERISN